MSNPEPFLESGCRPPQQEILSASMPVLLISFNSVPFTLMQNYGTPAVSCGSSVPSIHASLRSGNNAVVVQVEPKQRQQQRFCLRTLALQTFGT